MKKIVLLSLVFISTITIAQPFTIDKKVKPIELKLLKFQPRGKQKGKLCVTKAYQLNDTAYYYCKGVSIYSVAQVTIACKKVNQPISVSLHKNDWKTASKSLSLNSKKVFAESFKTEGSFGLRIISKKIPAVYNIYVWVSDEMKVSLPSPFASK